MADPALVFKLPLVKGVGLGDAGDSPLERTMVTIETVARFGPLRLMDLADRLPYSTSSVQRICAQLEHLGWLHRRVSDRAFILSSVVESMVSEAVFATPEEELVQRALAWFKAREEHHVSFATFDKLTTFVDIDSTKQREDPPEDHSILHSDAAVAAQSLMSSVELTRMLKAFLRDADPEEAILVRSGQHIQRVREVAQTGFALNRFLPSCAFPYRLESGAILVATIEPNSKTKQAGREFIEGLAGLERTIATLLFGTSEMGPSVKISNHG